MVVCWNCQLEQYDGTIFCVGCGVHIEKSRHPRYKGAALMRNAAAVRVASAAPHTGYTTAGLCDVEDEPVSSSQALSVRAMDEKIIELRLIATLPQNLVIGRTDKKRGIVPDIDLGQYGGRDAGVSRQHARLRLCNGTCTVEDLDSVNGTYLNHQRIPALHVVELRNGDELQLGTMRVRIAVQP